MTTPLASSAELSSPYGGRLTNLIAAEEVANELRKYASHLKSLQISERAACDLELLATGGFSPLPSFMGREDHERVLREMRLSSGHVFPIPVTLPLEATLKVKIGEDVALRDSRNELLAVLTIEEIYATDLTDVAQSIFGTNDPRHPSVAELYRSGPTKITGRLQVIQLPRHYDFRELRLTPKETRARLEGLGHRNVVAFQTRNPLHRAHEELIRRAAEQVEGVVLLHPAVGFTKPGDVDHFTRIRTYKALVANYAAPDRILLALLPLAMRLAGPREALWHAVIRRNYGATHLIVGRDHASPGLDSNGKPFYEPYAAQELVKQFSAEISVQVIPFDELVYLPDEERYEEVSRVPRNARTVSLSGTQVRNDLENNRPLPSWFTRPEVAEILAETYPPLHKQGVCIWFTGLSGSGKSTTAEILTVLLQEQGRHVTLLDGDVVRTHLSRGLGFSKEDRDLNIRRIGFVAAEIVRHGGMVICAAVSPYRSTRNDVRNMIGANRFVEVFVDSSLEECERRDPKGIYAKARRGEIKNLTGVDDPYEAPQHPELTLETVATPAEANAQMILKYLVDRGFVKDTSQ